jgi:hypothetical protein
MLSILHPREEMCRMEIFYLIFVVLDFDPSTPLKRQNANMIAMPKGYPLTVLAQLLRNEAINRMLICSEDLISLPAGTLSMFNALPWMWLRWINVRAGEWIWVFLLVQIAQGVVDLSMLGLIRSDIQ